MLPDGLHRVCDKLVVRFKRAEIKRAEKRCVDGRIGVKRIVIVKLQSAQKTSRLRAVKMLAQTADDGRTGKSMNSALVFPQIPARQRKSGLRVAKRAHKIRRFQNQRSVK